MYESPINIIISKLCNKLESDCLKSVQRYGFDIDKEELAKALNYDRKQYEKGHTDGYNKAIDDLLEDANEMAIEVDVDTYTMKAIGIGLLENIAEQLKAGGVNGKERS